MAKARKRPIKQAQGAVVKQPNKFELLYNRKKFNVLGKKSKGEVRSRVQSKSNAIDKRKNTLLVEHKQRQRANAFLDSRFGEDDSSLTADDKAIARFQKQRLKELAGSKSDLEETGGEEQLTHLGAALGENLSDGEDFLGGAEDLDLDHDATGQLHFGGGFTRKETDAEEFSERAKTKKEVMEEIIAKSKKAKAEKTKQREEDLDAVDKLDEELAELVRNRSFQQLIRPRGSKPKAAKDTSAEDAAFDIARRELVFEAKAKVGERTKTAEEVEEAEAARLQALERQRRALMSGDDLGDEAGADEGLPAGGYARKRAKKRKLELEAAEQGLVGTDEEDGSESEDEEGNLDSASDEEERPLRRKKLGLDERRQERAAGAHPLQQRFKKLSGALLRKHTGEDPGQSQDSLASKGDEEASGSEEGSEQNEASESESSESGGNAIEGDSAAEADKQAEADKRVEQPAAATPALQGGSLNSSQADKDADIHQQQSELPFVIPAPQTYQDFSDLVAARPAGELATAVRRIRLTNKAALAADGKQGLQVFYGILVQHFANLVGESLLSMDLLDAISLQILELTPEVPLYAATVALARLKRLQETLFKALQNPDSGPVWPSQRQILLLKLWSTVFQASDRRHPVLSPVALLVGACLTLGPVASWEHLLAGLFMSALGLHMSASADRLMPEPLLFALNTLKAFSSQSGGTSSLPRGWSLQLAPAAGKTLASANIMPLSFGRQSSTDTAATDLAASCVSAALGLVTRAAEIYKDTASFPELFAPVLPALAELDSLADTFPETLTKQLRDVQEAIKARSQEVHSSRMPLQKLKLVKEIKQFNPRFEEDFAQEKDYDVDRDRADTRKLKRMVSKERRGAMRELRKDAAFMGVQTRKEKDEQRANSRKQLRANSTWLQKLEQDFKSGGQGGMWKKKKAKR